MPMSGDEPEEAAEEVMAPAVEGTEPAAGRDGAGAGTVGASEAADSGPDAAIGAGGAPVHESAATPDDADDLRGYHFRALLHKPLTWVLVVGASLLLGVVMLIAFSPVIGAIVFVGVFLIALWITFNVADSRAADDFFHVYAKQRDLVLGGKTSLPPVTPLLRKGDDQYAERTLSGELAPGVGGILAVYTYVTESTDSNGNREKSYHPFTLGMTDVPECGGHVPELYCQRKSGLRALEKFEDVFRGSKQRVELESEALGDRYEIFSAKGQDPVWLRQLFSPTFIVWLTEAAPDKFAFELVGGTLVAYVRGHREDTADLDKVAAAMAMVASRLREKSGESAGAAAG
jgi:hypothetical protein